MDKDTIRTILCYIRKHTFLVILSLVLAAVTVVSTLYLPILTGHAIDCMIAKGKVDFAALRPILEKMIVTLAITGFSQWLMNVCNNRITYLVMREIREDAFHHIHDLPLKYLDGHPSGDIVSRVIADVYQFADGLLLGKDFAPAGARYFCPWWQKYPKAPFKGKGISYFPFPLKIPIP